MTHFRETMDDVRSMGAKLDLLDEAVQMNIWRSQILLATSAFDFFMHEFVKCGLVRIYLRDACWRNEAKLSDYGRLEMELSTVEEGINIVRDSGQPNWNSVADYTSAEEHWFRDFVDTRYELVSMASQKRVKEVLDLLGIDWAEIAQRFFPKVDASICERVYEERMRELFRFRNALAHQGGRSHSDAQPEPIAQDKAEEFLEDVDRIVQAIYDAAKRKTS